MDKNIFSILTSASQPSVFLLDMIMTPAVHVQQCNIDRSYHLAKRETDFS